MLLLAVVAVSGVGFAVAARSPDAKSMARITGGGAFDRSYDVSAFSAMIDSDGDATIVHSGKNQIRFEKSRVLVDGYVESELSTDMRKIDVKFTDADIVVTVDGVVLVERTRDNPRLAGLIKH